MDIEKLGGWWWLCCAAEKNEGGCEKLERVEFLVFSSFFYLPLSVSVVLSEKCIDQFGGFCSRLGLIEFCKFAIHIL